MNVSLHSYLIESCQRYSARTAVVEPQLGSISYQDLDQLSDRVRDRLIQLGTKPGDRVGIIMHKSIDSVACIFGTLKAGAAYVPVDVSAPIGRAAYIFSDCDVAAVFVEEELAPSLINELQALGSSTEIISLRSPSMGNALAASLERLEAEAPAPVAANYQSSGDDLAYILYTSGSTGLPKGVPLSHENGCAFVQWCSDTFQPTNEDRFSSHAPFHFDLSILDLYTPIKHGSALVLIGEELGKEPGMLAEAIEQNGITIWYSAPSILTMLVQFGGLESRDFSRLRKILFAGEVFPVAHLRSLMKILPQKECFNLYGPTETNVCTYHRVPDDFVCSTQPLLPIGKVCEHLKALVVDSEGQQVSAGEQGELIISGGNVMSGYWNLPEQTEKAFFVKDDGVYYRTGDIVTQDGDLVFTYIGRRDRMVKKRGYRVELGEIEAKLHLHPDILEAAVVAVADDQGVSIHVHYACRNGGKLSVIKLKKFSSEHLPVYMVPDTFTAHDALPKTTTDKTDYQSLQRLTRKSNVTTKAVEARNAGCER